MGLADALPINREREKDIETLRHVSKHSQQSGFLCVNVLAGNSI